MLDLKEVSVYHKIRQNNLAVIEKIEKIQNQADRYRAIQKLMFKLNPALVEQDRLHCAAVADILMATETRTWATAKEQAMGMSHKSRGGSRIRQLYSMPEYLYRALQAFEPEFQRIQSSDDKEENRKLNYTIWKIFPEYRMCREL